MTSTVRNADVVWLENWVPITYLDPESRMEMAFTHAEVWDIRARARKLQQLLKWQEEGAVVERWIENCSQSSMLSRLSLGRHLGLMWQRELGRRSNLSEVRPEFASEWQPPGADLLEENRFHCNDGPIGFALDAISQWHKQLTFVVRFLHSMEAAPVFSPLEYANAYGTADHSQVPAPYSNNRGGGSRTAQATARAVTEGTSSAQPSRAQPKRAADPPAPTRREEHPAAGDSHSVPREARRDVGCEGCGMRGHTASQCRSNRHPNWNAQHATVRWKDTEVAQQIKFLANGKVRSLPLMACNGFPQTESGLEESS